MSIYNEIKEVFPQLAIADISDYYASEIAPAKAVYQGDPPWKRVTNSGIRKKTRNRALLNTAKVVCDKMAALTFSEQCDITVSDPEYDKLVHDALEKNSFNDKFPEWLSRAFALGGGILKVMLQDGEIQIEYINADVFFPTKWDNRRVTEGVFRSDYTQGGKHYRVYEYHTLTGSGVHIENEVRVSDSRRTLGTPCSIRELFPRAEEKLDFNGVKTSLFSYFKPAIGNNRCFDIPLGLPIFANSYDTLESIDVIFDSLQREFILGKKRIIVPEALIHESVDSDGNRVRYFDANDEVYQAFTLEETQKMTVVDNTVTLRITEHTEALKAALDLLSMQIGLSAGSLSYDRAEGVKTATEVMANERDTMRTVENNKNIVAETIKDLCAAIISVNEANNSRAISNFDVEIKWKDNVISDDDTRIRQNIELVNAGLRSRKRAVIDINGYSEEDAQKELDDIEKETGSGGGSLDDLLGGANG